MKFGSLRNPGANLARLPVGLDLHTINIAEGIRAAVACGVLILANEWLHWPPLVYMALAANLTCFCDLGGPIRPRMAALLSFSILGGVIWGVFGLLTAAGLLIVLPLATLVFFCNAFARVWGQSAQTVGNLLSVVLIFALDRPLAWHEAPVVMGMFIAGGLWAIVLTLLLWRLHQYRTARESVEEVCRQLAALTCDLRRLAGARIWRPRIGTTMPAPIAAPSASRSKARGAWSWTSSHPRDHLAARLPGAAAAGGEGPALRRPARAHRSDRRGAAGAPSGHPSPAAHPAPPAAQPRRADRR